MQLDKQEINYRWNQAREIVLDMVLARCEAERKVARLLVTLSAGALLGTVSLVQVIVSPESTGMWLLPVSWGFLTTCLFLSIVYIWRNNGDVAVETVVKDNFRNVHDVLMEADDSGQQLSATTVQDAIEKASGYIDDSSAFDRLKPSGLLRLSMACFLVGLVCLAFFAGANLPW